MSIDTCYSQNSSCPSKITMRTIVIAALTCLTILSCENNVVNSDPPHIELSFTTPPISVPDGTRYAAGISYNNHPNANFDIFLPKSAQPTALVVFIHGGGFVGGDKSSVYQDGSDNIQAFLQDTIAFATINYRFRTSNPDSGIIVSLNDIKRCIQYIRYYATSFNIDKERIACYGGSAGGGASIYLAFHPDMADKSNPDPVLRESTRIAAAGHLTSQASYDPIVMLDFFTKAGIDVLAIPGFKESIAADYGLTTFDEFYTDPKTLALRNELDMLGWMSPDDPEFFVSNGNPNTAPTERRAVIHHPLHAKTLDDKATSIGLAHVTNITSMNIYAANNETLSKFMIRKLTSR